MNQADVSQHQGIILNSMTNSFTFAKSSISSVSTDASAKEGTINVGAV